MRYIEMEIRYAKNEQLESWEKNLSPWHWKHPVVFGQVHALYKVTHSALSARGILPTPFLAMLGIGRCFLSMEHDLDPLFNLSEQLMPHMPQKWKFFQTADVMVILTSFFEKCSIISLSDLNRLDNNIQLWIGIVQDILRPIGRTDLKFIIDPEKIQQCYCAGRVGHLFEEISRHATVLWSEHTGLPGQFAVRKADNHPVE
jgi:hypothetical protein